MTVRTLTIPARFSGPPGLANGGYVAGQLSALVGPGHSFRFRAPVPLDKELSIVDGPDGLLLVHDGRTCVEVQRGTPLTPVVAAPGLDDARAAGQRAISSYHRDCVCCSVQLDADHGLRVAVGRLTEDKTAGVVAGSWRLARAFAEADGKASDAIIWAALDCPGYYAWDAVEGKHFALTSAMAGTVHRAPQVGEECIILARTGEHLTERHRSATVTLYDRDGALLAQMDQVWVRTRRSDRPPGVDPSF